MSVDAQTRTDPKRLYVLAAELYSDLTQLAEGKSRLWFNRREYERLITEETIEFSQEEESKLHAKVEQELRTGRIKPWQKADRLQMLKQLGSVGIISHLGHELAMEQKKVPGEPDVIRILLAIDTTPDQIRKLCKEAFMSGTAEAEGIELPAWPIPPWSVLPRYLSQYAENFVQAKSEPRFPRCDASRRPTNLKKQLWFLARALAGAELGVKPRSAIDLVDATRPEQIRDREEAAWQALVGSLSLDPARTFVP